MFERENRRISFRYAEPSSYSLDIGYSFDDRQYEAQNDFEQDKSVFANFNLPLSPRTNSSVFARRSQIDSTRFFARQDRTEIGVSLNYRITNQLFLDLIVRGEEQTSDFDFYNYDGYSATLRIQYRR